MDGWTGGQILAQKTMDIQFTPAILCQQFQKEHCEFVSALSKSACEVCNLDHLCILGFLVESLKLDLDTYFLRRGPQPGPVQVGHRGWPHLLSLPHQLCLPEATGQLKMLCSEPLPSSNASSATWDRRSYTTG